MEIFNRKLKDNLAKYIVYSLFVGFLSVMIYRGIRAVKIGFDMSFVPMFSLSTFFIFISFAIISFCLLFIFTTYYKPTSKVLGVIDYIINNPLFFILLAVISFRFWYFSHFNVSTAYYDTASYMNYDHNIFLGEVDKFRTPIYPWFMKLVGFLFHATKGTAEYYAAIAHTQQVISVVGVAIFYFAACRMFKNTLVRYVAPILYGIAPSVVSWDLCILTESLSLFATVLCIYLIMRYLSNPTKPLAVFIGIYAFLMVMLRPTFVYMFAILGVFFVARLIFTKYDRKRALMGLVSLCVSGALLLGYCGMNKKTNDCFSISSVGVSVNQMYMVIDQRIYENGQYPEITKFIDERLGDGYNINYVIDIIEPANKQFTYSELSAYVKSCIANNKETFNQYTVDKFIDRMNDNIATQYSGMLAASEINFKKLDNIMLNLTFPFSFAGCFVLVLAAVIFAIYQLIRKKVLTWHILGLSAMIFTHLFVSIYGSMAEFARLSVMVVPSVYLLLFWFIDLAVGKTNKQARTDELNSRCDRIFASEPSFIYVDENAPTDNINENGIEEQADDEFSSEDIDKTVDEILGNSIDSPNDHDNNDDTVI